MKNENGIIAFTKGVRVPDDYITSQLVSNEDKLTIETTTPILGYLTLKNFSLEEKNIVQSKHLDIALSYVDDIVFLVCVFNNGAMSFDVPLYNFEEREIESNAFTLLFIEGSDFTFQGSRTLGLPVEFIASLLEHFKTFSLSKEDYLKKIQSIYSTYSTKDIFDRNSLVRRFE